jgi:hypothetical protein
MLQARIRDFRRAKSQTFEVLHPGEVFQARVRDLRTL